MLENISRGLFEQLLTNINCGIAIYSVLGDELKIEYLNDVVCRMAECDKRKLMKLVEKDILFTIDIESRDEVGALLKKILLEKSSGKTIFQSVSYKGNHAWIQMNITYIENEDSDDFVCATFLNVTENMEISAELERKYELRKRKCKSNQNTISYAVFNLKKHETIEIEQFNIESSMKHLMSAKQFRNQMADMILLDEQKEEFTEMFDMFFNQSNIQDGIDSKSIKHQLVLPNGKVIWVKSNFTLLSKTGGTNISLLYHCENINLNENILKVTEYIEKNDYDILGSVNFQDESVIFLYGKNSSFVVRGNMGISQEESYEDSLNWFFEHAVVSEEQEKYKDKFKLSCIKERLMESDTYDFTLHTYGKNNEYLTKDLRFMNYNEASNTCLFSQIDVTKY